MYNPLCTRRPEMPMYGQVIMTWYWKILENLIIIGVILITKQCSTPISARTRLMLERPHYTEYECCRTRLPKTCKWSWGPSRYNRHEDCVLHIVGRAKSAARRVPRQCYKSSNTRLTCRWPTCVQQPATSTLSANCYGQKFQKTLSRRPRCKFTQMGYRVTNTQEGP